MSRTPRKAPGTTIHRVGLPKFSTNLYQARIEKGMSMSDLARKIWGTFTDARGYEVPKNKDRISRWEKGDQIPEPHNLRLLADALDMSPEELAPDLTASAIDRDSTPAINVTMVQGQPGRVHLVVNTLTSLEVASKIIALLSSDPMVLASGTTP